MLTFILSGICGFMLIMLIPSADYVHQSTKFQLHSKFSDRVIKSKVCSGDYHQMRCLLLSDLNPTLVWVVLTINFIM